MRFLLSRTPRTYLLFAGLALATTFLAAQSNSDPAEIGFDLDLQRLTDKHFSSMFAEMENVPLTQGPQSLFAGAKRVSGSVSLPENIGDLFNGRPPQGVPLNFYLRLEMRTAQAAQTLWDGISNDDFEPVPDQDESWLKPNQYGPANLRLHRVNESTVEFGTQDYLQNNHRKFNSAGVDRQLASLPKHALRLAIDLTDSADKIQALIAAGVEQLPPQAAGPIQPFLEEINKIATLSLSLDMLDEKILTLAIDGRSEEDAQALLDTLNGLLNMAKFGAGAQLEELHQASPQTGRMMNSLLGSLKSTRTDQTVRLAIPKPAGFDEAIAETLARTEQAAARVRDMNRFRQAGLAIHNYYDSMQAFPFTPAKGRDESADLSWRVRILPYLEQTELHQDIAHNEGWNSSHNREFQEQMPELLGSGSDSLSDIVSIQLDQPLQHFQDITDGTSNTIALLQVKSGVPWMKPDSLSVDQAVALLDQLPAGEGLLAVFFDGSVRYFNQDIDRETFRSALLPNDGK